MILLSPPHLSPSLQVHFLSAPRLVCPAQCQVPRLTCREHPNICRMKTVCKLSPSLYIPKSAETREHIQLCATGRHFVSRPGDQGTGAVRTLMPGDTDTLQTTSRAGSGPSKHGPTACWDKEFNSHLYRVIKYEIWPKRRHRHSWQRGGCGFKL